MAFSRIRQTLAQSWHSSPRAAQILWQGLALLIAASYAMAGMLQGFSSDYVVQNDARQHVFWMQRFITPDSFPGDLIADYFQSVAPFGFSTLYRLGAALGLHPLVFNKILPLFIGLAISGFVFRIALRLYPYPLAAFSATVLLNQILWLNDDLASATPRAFATLLLLGFIHYLLRRSWRGCVLMVVLQGLFYPHMVLVSLGILILSRLAELRRDLSRRGQRWRAHLLARRGNLLRVGSVLLAGLLVLLPYLVKTSDFGPTASVAQARSMPEFQQTGRSEYFNDDFAKFWLLGNRSGILPRWTTRNPLILLSLALPVLLLMRAKSLSARQIRRQSRLLGYILLASACLFAFAHLLAFQLHLPSRYTQHSLPVVIALAAGIVLCIMVQKTLPAHSGTPVPRWRSAFSLTLVSLLAAVLILFPASLLMRGKHFPTAKYVTGTQPGIYEFLAAQPRHVMVASLSDEATLIPSFAQQSVLVSRHHAVPYQLGYYRQFRQRMLDLISAQYTPNLAELQAVLRRYRIDYLLLDRRALTPAYLRQDIWLWQYQPAAGNAVQSLQQGQRPAVERLLKVCASIQTEQVVVLDAPCLLRAKPLAGKARTKPVQGEIH